MSRLVDRPVRECKHPVAKHQHGDQLMYSKDGCRCEPCTIAGTRAHKRYRVNTARRGGPSRLPADDVRAHVLRLRKRGMNLATIASTAGVSYNAVSRLVNRGQPTVEQRVHDALMRVPMPLAPSFDSNRVDLTGSRRRLQALAALGYTHKMLAELLSMTTTNVRRIMIEGERRDKNHTNRYVSVPVRAKIIELYEQRWNAPPVPRNTRERTDIRLAAQRAAAAGWALPMDLDDDRLDDPAYRPIRTHRKDDAA